MHALIYIASGSANLCRGYDCRDGTCVGSSSLLLRCDELTQCPDGSDEFRCESKLTIIQNLITHAQPCQQTSYYD